MTTPQHILQYALFAAAAAQIAVALINFRLVSILGWRDALDRMPLLVREVFHVHVWFISITLLIFGVITARFAGDIATAAHPIATWLAAGIGLFWVVRVVLQVTYYSSSHWRGQAGRTVVHVVLLLVYGGMAGVYLWAAAMAV